MQYYSDPLSVSSEMKTFLVGGAVRDTLLGYPFHEKDWVVVGATPAEMIEAGYHRSGVISRFFCTRTPKRNMPSLALSANRGPAITALSCMLTAR